MGLASALRNVFGEFTLRIYWTPFVGVVCRIISMTRYYGVATSIVLNLLVRNVWCIEADLLHNPDDSLADAFQKSQQTECNMTAVTVSLTKNFQARMAVVDVAVEASMRLM